MNMYDCPRFDHCSAPICPLDPDWRKRPHLKGERICAYITVYSKPGERVNLRTRLPPELYSAVAGQYDDIYHHNAPIKYELTRSSRKPTKGFKTSNGEKKHV